MTDHVRALNADGIEEYCFFLQRIRNGSKETPPFWLLTDPLKSIAMTESVELQRIAFPSRFDFGLYLSKILSRLDRRVISHHHALWTWLSLYFFDEVCPVQTDGSRKVLEDAVYIVPARYNHQRYYRHIARTAWLTVSDHGENARVLMAGAERGSRARQAFP